MSPGCKAPFSIGPQGTTLSKRRSIMQLGRGGWVSAGEDTPTTPLGQGNKLGELGRMTSTEPLPRLISAREPTSLRRVVIDTESQGGRCSQWEPRTPMELATR